MAYMPGGIVRQEGVTYGPAMSRIGRTPIGFSQGIAESSGRYATNDFNKRGTIIVNPASTDDSDIGATIRHEDIHSILRNLEPETSKGVNLQDLNKANPYYQQIADIVGKTRGGEMPSEIPAYMGAYSKAFTPDVPQNLQQLYTDYFQKQLQQFDPRAASGYGRVAAMNAGANPNMQLSSDAARQNKIYSDMIQLAGGR
jgi:hypothetical protein